MKRRQTKALAEVLPVCLSPLRLPRSPLWEVVMTALSQPDVEWSVWEAAEEWLREMARAAIDVELWMARGRWALSHLRWPRVPGVSALKEKNKRC